MPPLNGGDGMVQKYEYVGKKEWKPVWDLCRECLCDTNELTKRKGYSFTFHPIGSLKRQLITRVIGGNKGFDIDVDLVIPEPPNGGKGLGKEIFDIFYDAVRKSFKHTKFSDPEDSTSVMTLKYVDTKNSRIVYSIDLAIMFFDEEGNAHVLHHYKENGGYGFQKRFESGINEKEEWVLENIERDELASHYLRLKNSNRVHMKRSRSLYYETISNLFDQYYEDEEIFEDPWVLSVSNPNFRQEFIQWKPNPFR